MLPGIYETFRDNDRYPAFWAGEHIAVMPHFHSSVEMVYVTEGSVAAMLGGKLCSVEADRLFLVPSYAAHAYYKTRGEASRSIMLIVPLDFIPQYAPSLSKKIFAKGISDDPFLNGEVLHCLRCILALGKCCERNENLLRSYIYVILGLIILRVGLADAPKDDFLSKDILMFLQENYLSPISLESLSRRFGYSKYRFSHIFNRSLGCTLTQYVDSLRARHAANLLRESDAPLLDIALSSGFDSVRTFYRSFKNSFGMTPTRYRRSAK